MKKTKIKKDLSNKIKKIGNGNKIRGITLISLILTIIVLLILSGVAINTLTGNGLFARAKEARYRWQNTQNYEEMQIAKYSNDINSYVDGNRETVTLTNEEYTMFKSQFSKNINTPTVSINKPNTWAIGTEYEFGDGIYGQRFMGTASIGDTIITTINNIENVINKGGIYYSNNSDRWPFPYSDGGASTDIYISGNPTDTIHYVARGEGGSYNIWILYTKKAPSN